MVLGLVWLLQPIGYEVHDIEYIDDEASIRKLKCSMQHEKKKKNLVVYALVYLVSKS